jgi:signal transduction histidine kinase
MHLRLVARLAALLVVAQILIVGASWWLLTGPPLSETPHRSTSSLAVQRLAELQAKTASRAVAASDSNALNDIIQQSLGWPEVAYVSVEDHQGKILAHTDATKVGLGWDDQLAAAMRATIKAPYQEVVVPLVDTGGTRGVSRVGRLRLGYIVNQEALAPSSDSPYQSPPVMSLAIAVVLAVIVAIPVAVMAAGVAETTTLAERGPTEDDRLAGQVKEARGDALRARNELASRAAELAKTQSQRDHYAAEAAHLQSELEHLRTDVAGVEATLEPPTGRLLAAASAEPTPRELRQELKRIQATTVTQITRAFRSSLTNVIGYSKLLLRGADGALTEPQRTNVVHIVEAGSRLMALVNGLSEYVRVDTGASEAAPEIVDVGPCLDEVVAECAHDDRLRVHPGPGPDPLLASVDRRHLRQILRALAIDALSLDPKATGTLSGRSRNDAVVVELALEEFHIASEDPANVLDLFASDDLSGPLDESRLRLALARCLAEANGGALRVETREPAEVAFVLELPAPTAVTAAPAT